MAVRPLRLKQTMWFGIERQTAHVLESLLPAVKRGRGGLTSELHTIADGRGRSLAARSTPGQEADTKQLEALLEDIAIARPGD